ncbi:MAG: hypothetical protein OEL53_05115 [Rhodospirillales bacterium]|nr:hypothetical protein [Rhodospirillales bacterium]
MKAVTRFLECVGAGFLILALILLWFFRDGILDSAILQGLAGAACLVGLTGLFARKLPSVLRVNLALTIIMLPLGAWGADIALQALSGRSALLPPQEARDTRSALQVVADLRRTRADIEIVPSVVPRSVYRFENDRFLSDLGPDGLIPLGGISGALTVFCNETGSWQQYTADPHGFNNPGPWISGDVFIVGDSFTHGACLADSETIIGRLRAAGLGIVNLGMSSNGPLHELAGLREYLSAVKPKTVLWFYFEGNDITTDLPLDAKAPLMMRYLEEPGFSQGLMERQGEIDDRLRKWLAGKADVPQFVVNPPVAALGRIRLLDVLLLRTVRNNLNLTFGPPSGAFALFERIIAQARQEATATGADFHLVYLPGKRRYANLLGRLSEDTTRDRTLAILSRNRVRVIDLVPVFDAQSDPKALFAGHYTKEGTALVANHIASVLNRR